MDVDMVMTKSFVDLGRVYQPGEEVSVREAKAAEYERLGWGRIVKPREPLNKRKAS